MLEYTLNNGKTLRIQGKKFEVDSDSDGNIVIVPMEKYSPFVSRPEYNFEEILEPAIDPEPSPVISFDKLPNNQTNSNATTVESEQSVVENPPIDMAMLEKGAAKFQKFIDVWMVNFGVENSEQPDRARLITDTMNQYSRYILKFIKYSGGLTNAVFLSTDLNPSEVEDRIHARLLSENIAQVGSILYPAISELLEYPFEHEP